MPRKRRLSQSTDGSLGEDASPAPTPKIKRRKKPAVQYDPLEFCQELYDTIRNHKTEDSRLLCEPFIRVPKRRADPEYYDVVSQPIDLLRIQHKLKSEEYDEIEQLTSDIELLVNNAKAFYKPDSQQYQDACDLMDLYTDTKNILINEAFGDHTDTSSVKAPSEIEDDASSVMTIEDSDQEDSIYEMYFAAIVLAQDGGRIISEMFKVLPSPTRYPDYYNVIQNPMDFKTIATKIQTNEYENLEEMFNDLNLMITNAKHFNEPGSQIYKDAGMLKKVIQSKKSEMDSGRRSRRGKRNSLQPGGQKLTAVCAALTYDEEEDSDQTSLQDNESTHGMDLDDESTQDVMSVKEEFTTPEWQLYNHIKYYKNAEGQLLAEPFMRLPSRRIYSDYYDEIKKPLSITNVRKKLKANSYRNIETMAAELELVFENARQYNADESKLYMDASMLLKALRVKLKELTGKEYDEALPITPAAKVKTKDEKTPGKRKYLSPEDLLRKRLNLLYKTIHEHQVDGRPLIDIFMVLPSKKDYPDYYQVIAEPIDMTMIDAKIKEGKYNTDKQLLVDFELMFKNARHYNEEGSMVYRDAETLDKVLRKKLSTLVPLGDSPRMLKAKVKTPRSKAGLSPLEQKLQDMYTSLKDHADSRGRVLSTPFIKLPLKAEYPDYYEVIKKPIDMLRVHHKMMSRQYEALEDMVSDFVLIFDNACKYNEPDSLIYKDALTLQRVCLEKKQELTAEEESNEVPDVKAIVLELMTNLYIAMYNHTDEDGRCFSDSFQDMPVSVPLEGEAMEGVEPIRPRTPSFEHVKKNLDKGRYRRMDVFQDDLFTVFEYARKVSRTDSQLYEDAVELQMFFIKKRDEICHNGEVLVTPALSYTERHLQASLEVEKREKLPKEQRDDDEKKREKEAEAQLKQVAAANAGPNVDVDVIEHNNLSYTLGDFVYLEPREKAQDPHIICIEKMWRDENGEPHLHGNFYLRPQETYHVATKKFLEKEVFKCDLNEDFSFSRVVGKCFVMNVKDYFKLKPDDLPAQDVYVCESRYNSRHRAFKKIKIWQVPRNEMRLIARDVPLLPVRVVSVFAVKKVEEAEEENEEPFIIEKEKEVVEIEKDPVDPTNDGCTYYEQYKTPAGWIKLGDCVYVRSDEEKPYIAMIDKMWSDQSGSAFFHGPWMVHPIEVEHSPTRLFYKREVFRSSIEDTNPVLSIQGKCAVLVHKDYVSSRPTEVPEENVYICESKYMEAEKAIRKLSKSMKKPLLSPKVCDDEIYFFKKGITPQKEPSPLLLKAAEEAYDDEDEATTDSNNTNIYKEELSLDSIPDITPREKKKKSAKPWQPSGYLVFSSDMRKQIQQENPEFTFGDISKAVGQKWREMPKDERTRYEEKAKRLAEEHAAKQQAADKAFNTSLQMYPPSNSPAPDARAQTPNRPNTPASNTPGGGFSLQSQTPSSQGPSQVAQPVQPARPPSPMFVSVPPRTQRLLHSDAYLRYIEGLGKDETTVSGWERSLTATQDNTTMDRNTKLPVSWLGQGVGHHDNAVTALWALRDLMFKDTLNIQRTLEFSQL